jgi:hypothetical protein
MQFEKKEKKPLTTLDSRQDTILLKLKELALEKGFGKLKCEIVIREGRICEVRHQPFEGVIRA